SWGPGLPNNVKTIAEYLKEAGYETARIGKNDLGRNFHKYNVREYPLNHGYDEFLGFSAHAHDYWLSSNKIKERTPDPYGTSALLGPLMHNMAEKSYEEGYLTDILTDESIAYIKRKREKPFFLTLAYSAVHHLIHEVPKKYLDKYGAKEIPNYDPDSLMAFEKHKPGTYSAYYDKYSRVGAIKAEELRNYYLANLNCLDDNIGRVLDALKEQKLDKNTLIVFISDNGGSPLTGANNAPLTGGKYALWEGGIRVPLAISWAGNVAANKVETKYVSATDILPTLLNTAGMPVKDETLDGISLLKPNPNRLLVWKWQKTWAVRQGDWKLTNTNENHWKSEPSVQYIAPIVDNMELKLFNVETDPGERLDLAKKFPEKVKELELAYVNWCEANIQK
ncbi:MAG TPA: sulfatase-like hydrolase/transferase, partial [Mariniflexile sp.]|nr:sulfatase-like hydrolase/transferase [Mariniflexile sp.]